MAHPLPSARELADGIRAAHERIRADIVRTTVEFSPALSERTGARVYLKWECDQTTGSFKFRGALNKLRSLSAAEKAAGVVSASTGNHGLALARAAKLEGVALRLFLPETAAEIKRKKIEALGIDVAYFGSDCGRTEVHARGEAGRSGRVFVSPYNDLDIIRGAGTAGLEIAADLPEAEDILVPVGGGGLIAGIAAFLMAERPGVRTMGVEPVASAFMAASVAAGHLVDIDEQETAADAVAGGIEPGSVTFPLYRELVAGTLLVGEPAIAAAMALLRERHGRMVEGAGALPAAGLLSSPEAFRGRTVLLLASGRNIAPDRFRAITGLA
ncbi:MAG TPA: pyridoxal-phosphate dependent enzyme [Terriglobales bacterium]|nr:pyridoxal-phosphate dependent enzyme [Terriglobales bacterium]